jgi:sphingosine kinase
VAKRAGGGAAAGGAGVAQVAPALSALSRLPTGAARAVSAPRQGGSPGSPRAGSGSQYGTLELHGAEERMAMMETGMLDELVEESAWRLGQGKALTRLALGPRGLHGPGVSLALEELVGVHAEGAALRFEAYALVRRGGCLGCCGGPALVHKSVTVVAVGKASAGENTALAQRWKEAALRLLGRPPEERRPLLVLINPMSGTRSSVHMWKSVGARVIAEQAGHAVDVVLTTRANHARDLVRDHPDLVAAFKGIVIVSGDGLIFEVLQGIMARKDWAHCVRRITVGMMPGGSGNGLCRSIHADAGLPHSPLSSAVLIARAHSRLLDVCAVEIASKQPGAPPTRLYMFLSFEWALASDIDIGSEYMRAIGEARFTIEAVVRWLRLRKYGGRLSFLPVAPKEGPQPRSAKDARVPAPPTYWQEHGDTIDSTNAPQPTTPLLPPLDQPVPESWLIVKDTFWNMWNCNVAWVSGSANVAPEADIDDGYIQMQYMRDGAPAEIRPTKARLLQYLLGLETGAHKDAPYVEMTPSQAFRWEPMPNAGEHEGILALDGEVVDYAPMQVQNLRGFMRIFGAKK